MTIPLWATPIAHANTSFGSPSDPQAHHIQPTTVIPGRHLPGLAGHATQQPTYHPLSAHMLHSNTALSPNIVVSSDNTPAPFGPQPRNGPRAALDPAHPNTLVVAYNDYTLVGQGSTSDAGYVISTDGGASWSQAQLLHGLLKTDGGSYDGTSDPAVAFDSKSNAYLVVTTFNNADWATGVYLAKMTSISSSSQFGPPIKVVAYTDTHHVVEYARLTMGQNALYLTFNVLSANPQAPNTALAALWTSQLYFTRSNDGGQTWSTPLAIGSGPQDYWGVPVVGWNGTVYVFYGGTLGLEMVQSSDGGQTWTSPRGLQAMSSVGEQRGPNELYLNAGPDAATDPGSHMLYVVYDGGKVTISADDGATWSQPMDVLGSSYAPAYLASISVDPAPYSHTVSIGGYSSAGDPSGNSFQYYYAQSSDSGYHFSSPILLSSNVSFPPALAFGSIGRSSSVANGGGNAHLFWTDTNGIGGNEQIMSATVDVRQPLMSTLKSSWDSGQSLPPWGLVFTASGNQTIGVANNGQAGPTGIGNVTVSTSGGAWLSATVTNLSNAYLITVSATASGSNQTGSITITASAGLNNSVTIPVQLLVNVSSPAFSVNENMFTFTTSQGIDPPPQGVQITSLSVTGDTLQIDTNNDPALDVISVGGLQNITLSPGVSAGFNIQLITAGLSGSSSHHLTVSDGSTSVTITITANITTAPAQLDDPGSTLSFVYHQQDASQPPTQSLPLHNSGGTILHWRAMIDVSWLTLGSISGTLAAGASQQLAVNAQASGLATGTYTGHIILGGDVQAINLPQVVTVYFEIDPPTAQLATTWYFAEGYVSANFSEFLTLENPSPNQIAHVSVTYLTQPQGQSPQAPFVLYYLVNSSSRYTIGVNSQPGIVPNDSVSMVVQSDIPIVAERPIYFKFTGLTPNPSGGSDVLGATHLGNVFFFPFAQFGTDQQIGSATYGTSYITFLTVLNQNNAAVNVSITYEGSASRYTVTHQVAAHSRGTLSLANDFPLAQGNFNSSYLYATSVMVTTDLPVVVEMPSYFTIPATGMHQAFASGTDEVGATSPHTNWDFAEGYTGSNKSPFLAYINLANVGNTPATATLTLGVVNGSIVLPPIVKQYSVPPQSSISVWLNALVCPQGAPYCGYAVGTHVSASQPLVVDRQMFFNKGGTISGATATVGSAAPASQYYFAEGYTGSGFSEYLTIVNPATNAQAETVTIHYLVQGGPPRTVILPQPLQPGQRWTESVNLDVGANQQVSVIVSTSSGTLIVERPMYFHYRGWASGGTDVIGYTQGN